MRTWMLLSLAIAGCGGRAPDLELGETSPSQLATLDGPIVDPVVIDVVSIEGHEYRFLDVPEEDGTPAVMILGSGPMGPSSPELRLRENAPVSLTAAELWMNLTHRDDVPEALVADHRVRTSEQGRSEDYVRVQTVERIDKQAPPVNQAIILPPAAAGACIDHSRWGKTGNQTGVPRFACTELQAGMQLGFWGIGPASSTNCCRTNFNISGDIRLGVYNESNIGGFSGFDQTFQFCYGPSTSGAWACFAAAILIEGGYQFSTWNTTSGKRLAVGIFNPRAEGVVRYSNWYATGRYIISSAPPIFGSSTFCQPIEGGEFQAGGSLLTCQ